MLNGGSIIALLGERSIIALLDEKSVIFSGGSVIELLFF